MQPTFFFIFFVFFRSKGTVDAVVHCRLFCHSLCVYYMAQSSCLPTGWKRANSWRRQLSRVIFLSTTVSPTYKGLFYKPIDVEKRTLCLNSKRDNKRIPRHSPLSDWLKSKNRETRTRHKTKHGRRQSLKGNKKKREKEITQKENSEEWKETPLFCYDPTVCSRTAVTRTKETITKVASNKKLYTIAAG